MKNICLILTPQIRDFASKNFPNRTAWEVKNAINTWQRINNKSVEDMPTAAEVKQIFDKREKFFGYTSSGSNTYEVSTEGDKEFSASNATFEPGTTILGVDCGGRTIEDVYLNVVKQSGEGLAPAPSSPLYGKFDSKEEAEDASFYTAYLPLWREWFRQHPTKLRMLYNRLRSRKTWILSDASANTRVSQARAIAEIFQEILDDKERLQNAYKILGANEEARRNLGEVISIAKQGISFDQELSTTLEIFTKDEIAQIESTFGNVETTATVTVRTASGGTERKTVTIKHNNLVVYSASRRTDPVFFSEELIAKINAQKNIPFNDPKRMNVIEIWSKHDGMPMENIIKACKESKVAPIVSFSVSSLGGTAMEPGVMKYGDMIDHIERLIKGGFIDPRTTTIRVDPILPGVTNLAEIEDIIKRCKALGIRKFVTSIMQSYGYNDERHATIKDAIDKALESMGKQPYNWENFYGKNQQGKINHVFNPNSEEGQRIIGFLKKIQDDNQDIVLESCGMHIDGLKASACLDPMIIEMLTGVNVSGIDRDTATSKQRPECECFGHSSDLLRYNDECNSSCVYCYAKHNTDNPMSYYDNDGNLVDKEFTQNTYKEADQETNGVELRVKGRVYRYISDGQKTQLLNGDNENIWDSLSASQKRRVEAEYKMQKGEAKMVEVQGKSFIADRNGQIIDNNGNIVRQAQLSKREKERNTELFTFNDGVTVEAPFKPTEQQRDALNRLNEFIYSTEKTITLEGYAGTGKTSVMNIFAQKIKRERQVFFTATTNAATNVLKGVVPEGTTVTTIHSLLGIISVEDFSQDNYNAKNRTSEKIGVDSMKLSGSIVVIDESSMINDDLYNHIQKMADEYRFKVIFMGDPEQLSPVKQDHDSLVFIGNGPKIQLTEVKRTGDNSILKNSMLIREGQYYTGVSELNDDNEGVIFTSSSDDVYEALDTYINDINKKKLEGGDIYNHFKIVAYTNAAVSEWNRIVRDKLGYKKGEPQEGEILTGYNNMGYYYDPQTKTKGYTIVKSENYEVYKTEGLKEGNLKFKTTPDDPMEINLDVQYSYTPIIIKGPDGKLRHVNFVDVVDNDTNNLAAQEVGIVLMRLAKLGKEATILKNAAWNSRNMDEYAKHKKTVDWVNNTKKTIEEEFLVDSDIIYEGHIVMEKAIDFGYAVTAHKSQGSTVNHVIVDDRNLMRTRSAKELKRLRYVAITRARKSAMVIIRPEDAQRSDNTSELIKRTVQSSESKKAPEDITELDKPVIAEIKQKAADQFQKDIDEAKKQAQALLGQQPQGTQQSEYVEEYEGNWTRDEVAKQTDKVFLFGDNLEDAKTGYVPSETQAVIRGLPNAIGVPTKRNSKTNEEDTDVKIPNDAQPVQGKNTTYYIASDYTSGDALDSKIVVYYKKGNDIYRDRIPARIFSVPKLAEGDYDHTFTKAEKNNDHSFITSEDEGYFIYKIREAFNEAKKAIDRGKKVVIPKAGIGTGKAQLSIRSPKILELINQQIEELKQYKPKNTQQQPQQYQPPQANKRTVKYTIKGEGRTEQEYEIVGGTHIMNKNGQEVFKEDSVDRNMIFAKLALQEKRAVKVTYKGAEYVVNNKDAIVSMTTGKLMKWGAENGDRKAILELARQEFDKLDSTPQGQEGIQAIRDVYAKTLESLGGQSAIQPQGQKPGGTDSRFNPQADQQMSASRSFSKSSDVTIGERESLETAFKPRERREVVEYVAQRFSNLVDKAIADDPLFKSAIARLKDPNTSVEAKAAIKADIERLRHNRKQLINNIRPKSIFDRILNEVNSYIQMDKEQLIQNEVNNAKKLHPNVAESTLRTNAENLINTRMEAFKKLKDNMRAVVDEACAILKETEGIKLNTVDDTCDEISDKPNVVEDNNTVDPEEKEKWQVSFRTISAHASLSADIRALLRSIKDKNTDGFVYSFLGIPRYINPNKAKVILFDALSNMTSVNDMMPALKQIEAQNPWVTELIKKLEQDQSLKSKFYRDMRKDKVEYWIQKKEWDPKQKKVVWKTVRAGEMDRESFFVNTWKANTDGGIILDQEYSVYDSMGNVNYKNAERGYEAVLEVQKMISKKTLQEISTLINNNTDGIADTLTKLLHGIGVDTTQAVIVKNLLANRNSAGNQINAVSAIVQNLNIIYSKLKSQEDTKDFLKTDENGKTYVDIINNFTNVYSAISNIIPDMPEGCTERSVRINGKTHYTNVTPNYLGKLVKELKGITGKSVGDDQRFQRFIDTEYKKYKWFYDGGRWKNWWLERLESSQEARDLFEHKVVLEVNGQEYSEWDKLTKQQMMLAEFFLMDNGGSVPCAYYNMPIMSDAESAEFIKFYRIMDEKVRDPMGNETVVSYKDTIIGHLENLLLQEYDRIKLVTARHNQWTRDKNSVKKIANFDIAMVDNEVKSYGGAEFKFLPELNKMGRNSNGVLNVVAELEEAVKNGTEESYMRSLLNKVMSDKFDKYLKEMREIGLLDKDEKGNLKNASDWFKNENDAISKLENYFYNTVFAQANIIEITTTDLAYYKDITDFQKRYKEVHAPGLRLDTQAMFNGVRVGKDFERVVTLKDIEITSQVLNEIEAILTDKVSKGEMSEADKKSILKAYSEVNFADAQAYRTLDSYRCIQAMCGEWTQVQENAYNNMKAGIWDAEDFNVIWQTIKPYVFTQKETNSQLDGEFSQPIKVPVQHKNSEFLLLAMHSLLSSSLGTNSVLAGIDKFMTENNIDVVQFESTTKCGKQGAISLADCTTATQAYNKLTQETGCDKSPEGGSPEMVAKISYEDYCIQVQTPEHFIDSEQLFGSQIRKLIMSDISNDAEFDVNGTKYKKGELIELYNDIVIANVRKSYEQLEQLFGDKEALERRLIQQIKDNDRYDNSLIDAVRLDENGEFAFPLHDPIQTERIQQLFNSIVKTEVTKQKIAGGALIQASGFGVSNDLHIVFKDRDGNEVTWESYRNNNPESSYEDYVNYAKEAKEKGDLAIAYFECYAPVYSRELIQHLMKPGTHELDYEKLKREAPDLLNMIGYRVPTEDKYSMAPLRIKGFTPSQNGSCIMLPAEITTIAGSDFDVDKLYVMRPEYYFLHNIEKAWKDFFKEHSQFDDALKRAKKLRESRKDTNRNEFIKKYGSKDSSEYTKDQIQELIDKNAEEDELSVKDLHLKSDSEEDRKVGKEIEKAFNEWYTKERRATYTTKPRKVKYDSSKSAMENTRAARNNMLIDIMNAVLTHPDTAGKLLNPGGFDLQKKAARIIQILENGGMPRGGIRQLESMSLKELEALCKQYNDAVDPLSPYTQLAFHEQNMTGAKLIGIYANQNANHALLQQTKARLSHEFSFTFCGRRLTELHSIKNDSGDFISRYNAGYLAASVDNVKDLVLAWLNQNDFTANITCLLSRLGYNPTEIGLFMAQPAIKKLTAAHYRGKKDGKSDNEIFMEVYDEYSSIDPSSVEIPDFINTAYLSECIDDNRKLAEGKLSPEQEDKFRIRQAEILLLFNKMAAASEPLEKVVQSMRGDTQNGGAGPAIADNISSINNIIKVYEMLHPQSEKVIPPIIGLDGINPNTDIGSDVPMIQAFTFAGLLSTEALFSQYFPYYSSIYREAVDAITNNTAFRSLSSETINDIFRQANMYALSILPFFGDEAEYNRDKENDSASITVYNTIGNKRADFIRNFPGKFEKMKEEISELAQNDFLKLIVPRRPTTDNVHYSLMFRNAGQLSDEQRERYRDDWKSMMYSDNPEVRGLAMDLFKYAYYTTGFTYSPMSYIHLAPLQLLKSIPGYVEVMKNIRNLFNYNPEKKGILTYMSDDLDPKVKNFIDQFYYHNLTNKSLVPVQTNSEVTATFKGKQEVDTARLEDSIKDSLKMQSFGEQEFFKPYIAIKIDDRNTDYYRYIGNKYIKIKPLGAENGYFEYEFGKDPEEINRVRDITEHIAKDVSSDTTLNTADDNRINKALDAYNNREPYTITQVTKGSDNLLNEALGLKAVGIQPNVNYKDATENTMC